MAGLGNRDFSVHKLRHTAATLMYRDGGVDVRVLKDILGHEQLNTTQIYTHVSNAQMESAMQSNPLADQKPPKHQKKKRDPKKNPKKKLQKKKSLQKNMKTKKSESSLN